MPSSGKIGSPRPGAPGEGAADGDVGADGEPAACETGPVKAAATVIAAARARRALRRGVRNVLIEDLSVG
ncbi:hypothetical protein GCM10010317_084170 [Streptomyces mirabilis]|nr:hypothetical protein GCM10010317_084170 [Streptomyces mirabilis]